VSISRRPVRLSIDTTPKEAEVKYVMLIHQGSTPRPGHPSWDELDDAAKGAIYAEYGALNQTPGMEAGYGMEEADTATTVRVEGGEVLTTDGPYAEIKDAVGGYFILEADDIDAAIEVAAKVPAASRGGGIEIRPVKEW
jgi:hypothetical protein